MNLLDLSLQLPESLAYTPEHKAELARELRDRVATMPGVADVTTARAPNDLDLRDAAVSIDGENPSANNTKATLYYTWIQPGYFRTLGVPLLAGHGFAAGDAGEKSVILSESAANQLWPGKDPMGRTLRMSTGAVKVALFRLRRRFAELVRAEVAETVARPEDVDAELNDLRAAFRDGP